ncbi:MAG: hypothetical protein O2794_00765 [bacterium]|nr:hypothetical protein [bacterium]
MRKHLFVAFLGIWVAVLPFLPISYGTTYKSVMIATGLIIAGLSVISLRETTN